MIRSTALVLALAIASTLAQAPIFGQCGGQNWTGPTTCATGSACVVQNPFFSQCVPGAATTTPAPPTSTTSATTSTTKTTTSVTSTVSVPTQTGFVKTSGTRFTLNGAKYTLFGSNAYWLPLMGYSNADIDKAFADIVASGATTVRTWGFNEVTAASGTYFHLWSGKTATVNTGANGLGALDTVIASAKAHGIRLIISLTNNWSDYGGMDVYTAQLVGSGQPHDVFYTNPTVIAAFKTYVQAIVTRYVNEPTILSIANEPRCGGSSTVASANCTVSTITTWATTISAFIKSIDPNHLVAIGDEGFFNEPGSHNFDFVYQGTLGIDFAANMKISTIDFGTFHTFPPGSRGGIVRLFRLFHSVQWITDHATIMTSSNKPVIMEEFGIPSFDQTAAARASIYSSWYQTILNNSVTGDLIWQAGSQLTNGPTPDDGYMIFPTDPVYTLMQSHSAALKARG
ncbi:glycoside hydrolase [Mycena filopes]|nr:glycoside hydrolase [Mycena filopes]